MVNVTQGKGKAKARSIMDILRVQVSINWLISHKEIMCFNVTIDLIDFKSTIFVMYVRISTLHDPKYIYVSS